MNNHKNAAPKAAEKATTKKAAVTKDAPELRGEKPTLHKLDVVVTKAPKQKEE